jgi:hypothetical protein
MRNRMIFISLFGFLLLISYACGGRLYKVAPLPESKPPEFPSNGANSFNLAAAVLDGDQSLDRFEANLPLSGVIAVDVRMINNSERTIQASSLRFELRDSSGKKLKPLTPKKALSSVMKYYGNSFYTKAAYRQTLSDYESVALKLNTDLEPKEGRRGMLFFQTRRETTNVNGLTLSVTGPIEPMKLELQTTGN